MTELRQRRYFQATVSSRAVSALCAAVCSCALLLPITAWASPHSHARHPLPTALHSTTVSETGTHGAGKKGKAGTKGRAKAQAAGAHSDGGSRQGGRRGKGRKRQAEPAEDIVPMFRAGRDGARPGHPVWARHGAGAGHGRVWESLNGPAPLASAYRHGHPPPSMGAHAVTRHAAFAARPLGMTDRARVSYGVDPATGGTVVMVHPGTVASGRGGVYAEGVSHPDGDESFPKSAAASKDASVENDGGAPIARVTAATPYASAPTPSQPRVVQGFGGEVAVPGGDGTERPGGTRRRNHPATWSEPSAAVQSEPLAEREAITYAAVSPAVLPEIYDRNGRLLMPAPLKGSHEVLVHQNLMATNDGLERIYDDADLERLRAAHLLVSLPASESLRVNPELPANRRVARPWTAQFAGDLAHAFYQRFGQPITVTSAVRTVNFQARLQHVNGNAAATSGESASPHLTGQAIDMGKRGMTLAQLAWMRDYLLPLMQAGKIDVEEEFQQACFHVSVYRSYAVGRRVVREYAQARPVGQGGADAPETR